MITAPDRVIDNYPTRNAAEITLLKRQEPTVWGRVADAAAPLAGFDANGFVTIDGLLTADEVDVYRDELRRLSADPEVMASDRTVLEPGGDEIRSIFEVHKVSDVFAGLVRDPRVVGRARQILGSDVYVHQSRINYWPGFHGKGFYWHSDFETWHAEDGMPAMRAVSILIALTENYTHNGSMMIIPRSHRTFVSCVGATIDHYRRPLRKQEIGTPDPVSLSTLTSENGITLFPGRAGSAVMFDSNCMRGSSDNITPFPRSNVFIVFNSVENTLVAPFAAQAPRPGFIASRDFTPVRG